MIRIRLIIVAAILTASLPGVLAQKTSENLPPLSLYHSGLELFNKEKFVSAQEMFGQVAGERSCYPAEMRANASYYMAQCGLILSNGDAEKLAMDFIRAYPENPKVNAIWFQLARYYFNAREYGSALQAFERVNTLQLSKSAMDEYYFKSGYCYFIAGNSEQAKKTFFEIVGDEESVYWAPANYYFAHIAYSDGNYETALKSFRKLLSDGNYGKIAPYYLIHIYHYQKKYDDIIALAPAMLDSTMDRRFPETARILAEAYYHKEKYSDAIPFLELYLQKSTLQPAREDYYMIGYTYYRAGDCVKATSFFKNISSADADSLAQLACYHMGECYLKTGQKNYAMSMFDAAYRMKADPAVTENSMFNYAKLAYETAYNPYNEAANVFNAYIEQYPNSGNADEAYEYLSNIYLSTRNYRDALNALENIKKRSPALNQAYQRVAFLRAVELFNDTSYSAAVEMLERSLRYPLNRVLEYQSYYWKAEAFYRMSATDSALASYLRVQSVPGSYPSEEYYMTWYGMGYCYFNKKNYSQALANFRKVTGDARDLRPVIVNDAFNRAGDCFFMMRDYTNAIEFYDKGIQMKLIDTDYDLYQKALSFGALARFEGKAATLLSLVENYKGSHYADDALFELANTYQNMNNNSKAIEYYDRLLREHPRCAYISQAMLRKGMIYYNEQKDEQALATLKEVVSRFPASAESKEALVSIRNVYVDMDKVDDFFRYIKDLPFANVSDAEQDSITYIAVENRYMNNDCENASKGFASYLEKFPSGIFITDAHFYLAECLNRAGKLDEAYTGYNFVIGKPWSKYSETSLLKAAEIAVQKKNCEAALGFYSQLEKSAQYKNNILLARIGLMRCNFQNALYQSAIEAARTLLTTDKVSEDLVAEAHLTIGKSAMSMDSLSLALAEFMSVAHLSKSEMGAEAKYNIALIRYRLGEYEESEKSAFDLINQVPSYDYWVAKSFILLADNYLKTGNIHQAKYTLRSIIDNYEGPDLVKEAQDRLTLILDAEKQEELRKAEELLKQQQQQSPPPDFDIQNP